MASMTISEYERFQKLEDIMDELERPRRDSVFDLAEALVKEQREIRGGGRWQFGLGEKS